ncbi:MAG TPA: BamA/TamA family outer membrane protein, partial [Polyangia bacterium]
MRRRSLPSLEIALGTAVLLAGLPSVAAQEPSPADEAAAEAAPPPAPEPIAAPASETRFGHQRKYRVAGIEVEGNRRTDTSLILGELGLAPGDVLTPDDPRVPLAELRLRSLGHFVSVQLRLERFPGQRGDVMLIVNVVERGTLVLNALHLGSSEATDFWGGLDVSETNLLGRGIVVGAGALASTTPDVAGGEWGRAFNLRAAAPARKRGLLLAGSFLYNRGSEFVQVRGREADADPARWQALNVRRIGATVSVGRDLTRSARLFFEGRVESIHARLPAVRTRDLGEGGFVPVHFDIREGSSRLGSLTATLDLDTRSDPVMPARGRRWVLSLEAGLPVFGSTYSYAKGVAQGAIYFPSAGGHVVAVHGFAGAILGAAPYFTRFFVGDLNFLLPPRALGLNFSTRPSRDFLDTSVSERRYEQFAGRALVEYAIPLWRSGGFAYRGDIFAAFGIFGLADLEDLRARDTGFGAAMPIDLT